MLPTLRTRRLILSPFTLEDAPEVQRLASDAEVARCVPTIAHPYPDGAAERWIARHLIGFLEGQHVTLAIRLANATLLGAVGLTCNATHRRAELGYWIGRPFWNNGYATEAAREVVRFAFDSLDLNRITARCFADNLASVRVLEKVGMTAEGVLRQHLYRDARPQDIRLFGLLQNEFREPS